MNPELPRAVGASLQRRQEGGVLRASWQWMYHRAQLRTLAQLAVLVLLAHLVFVRWWPRAVWYSPFIFVWLALGLFAWLLLVSSLTMQNTPAHARLVPGHPAALKRVLIGAALLLTGLAAGIGVIAGWLAGTPALVAWIAALAAGALLLAAAWCVRLKWLTFAIVLVPAVNAGRGWIEAVTREWAPAAASNGVLLSACGLVSLVCAWSFSLPLLIQHGGARHQRRFSRRLQIEGVLSSAVADRSTVRRGRLVAVGEALSAVLFHAWQARVASRRHASVFGRAFVGLGPSSHWTGVIGQSLVTGGLIVLIQTGLPLIAGQALSVDALRSYAGLLAIFPCMVSLSVANELCRSRREQALLVLLPGMPRGAALNRALARRLLAQCFGFWSVGLSALLILPPSSITWLGAGLMTFLFALLPAGTLLCRDWSVTRAPDLEPRALPVLGTLVAPLGAVALQFGFGVSPGWWAAALAVMAIALIVPRWRRLRTLPSAWPTGRRA